MTSIHDLAFDFALLQPLARLGVEIAVMIAGGILSGLLWTGGDRTMRRVAYLMMSAILALAMSLSRTAWGSVEGFDGPAIDIAFAINMAAALISGFVFIVASASRSRDIRGDGGLAWLAFVPLVGFYLIFAGRHADLPRARRGLFTRYIADPLICLVAIALYIGAGMIDNVQQRGLSQPTYAAATDPGADLAGDLHALRQRLSL